MQRTLSGVTTLVRSTGLKVAVVGAGQVGMAVSFALVSQNVCNQLALVDKAADKLRGEAMDLEQGSVFSNCKVTFSTDYEVTKDSKLCIITAGSAHGEGETRLDLLSTNVSVMRNIVPKLMAHNENPIILVVSNPVDVLTYVVWKLSGLPKNRVFGSGTALDTARLRFFISQRLDIAASDVHGWVIAEHGDSSVPIWSSMSVGGVLLKNLGSGEDEKNWNCVHQEVVQSAYDVIKLKGYTSWAVGLTVANLARAVLFNTRQVFPVSTHIDGCKHYFDKEVFLSLPCVIGENGIDHIVKMTLTDEEKAKLQRSASILYDIQSKLQL